MILDLSTRAGSRLDSCYNSNMQNQGEAASSPTFQKHRRQVFWQIILPVVAAGVIFIALGLLAVLSPTPGGDKTGQWAAISTIWLVAPLLFIGLLFLAVMTGLIYLMSRFLTIFPAYLRLAQMYAQVASLWVVNFCNRLSAPFIKIGGWNAGARALRSKRTRR